MKGISLLSPLLLAIVIGGCESQAGDLEGERFRIPADNLLRNTFAGQYVDFVFGGTVPEDKNEIGLVFAGKEVADAIPGFHGLTQGYLDLVDASPSVVVEPTGPHSNFDETLARNVALLSKSAELAPYGDTGYFWAPDSQGLFNLTLQNGSWDRDDLLPPSCRIAATKDGGTYHSCLFRLRRDGFEYSFWLSGENVAQADAFVDFVHAKLESWKVSEDR